MIADRAARTAPALAAPDLAAPDLAAPALAAPALAAPALAALGLMLGLGLAACTGTTGTVAVDLVTAPGSPVLDGVQKLRMTLTAPRQVVEAVRGSSGFNLSLELDAANTTGALLVEGFDSGGTLIACGQSPEFPLGAISAHIAVYVAAPRSIALSPVMLDVPRSKVAGVAVSFGAVIAGGLETGAGGTAPTTAIAVYNAFDHSLSPGLALPTARSAITVASGAQGGVYLFGGDDANGLPIGTLLRFDTSVPPRGAYTTVADQPGFARTGQLMLPIGVERYLITGNPPLELASGAVTPRGELGELPATGAATVPGDDVPAVVLVGDSVQRLRADVLDTLSDAGRTDATATALPDRRIAVFGGDPPTRDALMVNAATGLVTTVPQVLSTPRRRPSVATTPRHVIVAGGTDASGAPIASADVLDASTLAPIVTLSIVARSGAFAVAMSNDQVLIGGGEPASAALELFTPEPPAPGVR
jgi:hypothetical protein